MEIQQFEIAIRIMGGLLSSYQLDGDLRFLQLAEDLAKRMMPVFESPTGMPYRLVNLRTGKVSGEVTNPCEIGSMLLEYGMLSKLTNKPEYYEKCKRGVVAVFERRAPKTNLVGTNINVETGEWTNKDAHIGACIDAYYEYLLKGWLLFGDKDLKNMWDICKKVLLITYPMNVRQAIGTDMPTWKPVKEQGRCSERWIVFTELYFVWIKI